MTVAVPPSMNPMRESAPDEPLPVSADRFSPAVTPIDTWAVALATATAAKAATAAAHTAARSG